MKLSQLRLACAAAALAAASAPALAAGPQQGTASRPAEATQKTRAQVHAEAVAWVASGMSQVASGERGFDPRSPVHARAMHNFNERMSATRPAGTAPRAR